MNARLSCHVIFASMMHLLPASFNTHLRHVSAILDPGRKDERNPAAYGLQIPSKNMLWRFGLTVPPIGQNSTGNSVVTLKPDCVVSKSTVFPPMALNMDSSARFESVIP